MNILLWTTLVVALVAVAVTIYAVVSAKDGTEDEFGFHLVSNSAVTDSNVLNRKRSLQGPSIVRAAPSQVPSEVAPLTKTLWASHT